MIRVISYPIHVQGISDPQSVEARKESEIDLDQLLNTGFSVLSTEKVAINGMILIVFFLFRLDKPIGSTIGALQ